MRPSSPLRYAGSRNRSWRYLLSLSPVDWTHFREPFTGSASMLLYLPKCQAWINDISPAITRFHRTVKEDEAFINRVMTNIRVLDTEDKLRSEFERCKLDFAMTRDPWATFMLNRFACVHSVGFHRRNIASFCKAYGRCGFTQSTEACLRAEKDALLRNNTVITTGDYNSVLTTPATPGARVWIFVDPPYRMNCHQNPYYEHMFSDEDHKLLAQRLKESPFQWTLTINRDRFTEAVYGSLGKVVFRRYPGSNAHQKRNGFRSEMIVRNY